MKAEFGHDRRLGVAASLAAVAALTTALAPFHDEVGLLNAGLLFLLLTLLASATWGRIAGLLTAISANLCLNFFFVEPLHEPAVADAENAFGLVVFLVVSVVGSSLLARAQEGARQARRREEQTQALLRLSRALIGQTEPEAALDSLCREIVAAFGAPSAAVLVQADGTWECVSWAGRPPPEPMSPVERGMVGRSLAQGTVEGVGNTGLGRSQLARIIGYRPSRTSGALIVAPLIVGDEAVGALRVEGPLRSPLLRDEPEELLRAFAVEAALGVQRLKLARIAAASRTILEASEAKTDLMMAISHDLKTPLAAIKTSVSSLLDRTVRWSEDDTQAFLETIDSQADYLNRAISDLLDMNRLESGAVRPILRLTNTADLLSDAVERARAAMHGRSVVVEAELDLKVTLDRSLVEQALVNLLENAAKYSREGGCIRLASRRTAGGIEIEVSDEGPGIDPADVPRIFERFYRARGDGRTAGTGLGLALARAFAHLSGGEIRVESSTGGTRFVLLFPGEAGRLSA